MKPDMSTKFELQKRIFWFRAGFYENELISVWRGRKLTQLDVVFFCVWQIVGGETKNAPRDGLNAGKTKFLHVAR